MATINVKVTIPAFMADASDAGIYNKSNISNPYLETTPITINGASWASSPDGDGYSHPIYGVTTLVGIEPDDAGNVESVTVKVDGSESSAISVGTNSDLSGVPFVAEIDQDFYDNNNGSNVEFVVNYGPGVSVPELLYQNTQSDVDDKLFRKPDSGGSWELVRLMGTSYGNPTTIAFDPGYRQKIQLSTTELGKRISRVFVMDKGDRANPLDFTDVGNGVFEAELTTDTYATYATMTANGEPARTDTRTEDDPNYNPTLTFDVRPESVGAGGFVAVVDSDGATSTLPIDSVSTIEEDEQAVQVLRLTPDDGYKIASVAIINSTGADELDFIEQENGTFEAALTKAVFENYEDATLPVRIEATTERYYSFDVKLVDTEADGEPRIRAGFYARESLNSGYLELDSIPLGEAFTLEADRGFQLGQNGGPDQRIIVEPLEGYEIRSVTVVDLGDSINPLKFYPGAFEPTYMATLLQSTYFNYEDATGPVEIAVEAIQKATTVAPFNRLFVMDSERLQDFSTISLYDEMREINRGDYIINLIHIPFRIPPTLYPETTEIKTGGYATGINAPYLLKDVLRMPLGAIEVPERDGSALDYQGVTYTAYFPFIPETVDLNPTNVVGKSVAVEYVVDAYFGDLTVNLYNDESGTPFHSFKSTVGRNIPIRIFYEVSTELAAYSGIKSHFLRAYIERRAEELAAGDSLNLVSRVGPLSEPVGYIEVDKIELNTSAKFDEMREIISALREGVTIK